MPIRIYALAKDLNIDSKELVEVCKKAGIHGKGSALASLDDEEIVKVKAYLSGPPAEQKKDDQKTAAEKRAAQDTGPISRDDYIAVGAKKPIKVITSVSSPSPPSSDTSDAATATEVDAPPEPEEVVAAEAPPAEEEPSQAPPAEQEGESEPQPVIDDGAPIRPASVEPTKPLTQKPVQKPARKKRAPVINIAKLPDVKQPTPTTPTEEVKAQKPDIRLPKDAIAGHKKGARPPLEHLTAKDKSPRDSKPRGGDAPATPGDAPAKSGRRGGKAKAPSEEEKTLAGMASSRASRQTNRRAKARQRLSVDDGRPNRQRRTLRRTGKNTAAPRKGKLALELPCTVRSFSESTGVGAGQIVGALMRMGVNANINARMDDETAEELVLELGLDVEFKQQASLEDELLLSIQEADEDPELLSARPPVITFLGHVDHGKTSLLDRIINIDVVSGEAGGITQHIRAYKIQDKEGREISFVDTPGHEAFTEMRARGANVTDVAVLVIAADDGIMPQTEEAISHAKAAEVPIVVAMNKMDLPGADTNRVMTQMTEHELIPSEWGGDVEVVPTSAITGDGIDDLLETLQGIAELHEYQANASRDAHGVCLEAEQEGGRGVIAKVMVKGGTLKVGDVIVCGAGHGRVKAMYDTLKPRMRLKEAGPSTPVNITGLDVAPEAGEAFYVLDDIAKARDLAQQRGDRMREQGLAGFTTKVSYENFLDLLEQGKLGRPDEVITLNLIIRADVRGSIEAIQKELEKLEHPEVQVKTLLAGVGGVTVGDVTLADASQAVVVAFNVIPDENARSLADERQVQIRRYDVIYKVTDDIKAMLEGKLKPEEKVVELGRALVKQVFPISRLGAVAGCYVAQGNVERGCRVRVFREGRSIGDYPVDSVRREKEDVKVVPRGMECGIKLSGFNDIKKDDVLEAYKIEEVARTL